MEQNKVLIIEADANRSQELKAVLDFIDYQPAIVADSSRWKEAAADPADLLAVLIGTCKSKTDLESILSEIHKLDAQLPIFLLAERGKEPTVAIDRGSCILGRVELPLRHMQLTTALHQAEVY